MPYRGRPACDVTSTWDTTCILPPGSHADHIDAQTRSWPNEDYVSPVDHRSVPHRDYDLARQIRPRTTARFRRPE